jgi:hypothetical protein
LRIILISNLGEPFRSWDRRLILSYRFPHAHMHARAARQRPQEARLLFRAHDSGQRLDHTSGHPLRLGGARITAICRSASRAHARDWIITQQLGRRNLTAEQKKYLIGLRFNSEKAKPGGTGANQHKQSPQNEGTAERLAEDYKIGKATVERSGQFAAAVDAIAANVGPQARTAIQSRHG